MLPMLTPGQILVFIIITMFFVTIIFSRICRCIENCNSAKQVKEYLKTLDAKDVEKVLAGAKKDKE